MLARAQMTIRDEADVVIRSTAPASPVTDEKSNVPQDRNPEHLLNNEQLSCSVDLLFCFLYNSGNRHPITNE